MASEPRGDAPATRQLTAAVTLLAAVVTFGVAYGVLAALLGLFGLIGPLELALVAAAAGLVTWLVVRRLRAA